MSDIIDILKNAPEYIGGNGRTDTEIETAEKQLGIKFSPDYRCYLKDIGLACFVTETACFGCQLLVCCRRNRY